MKQINRRIGRMRLARPALSALSGLLIPLLLAGCGKGGSSSNEIPSNLTMSLTSEAFSDDQQIPREYTCDGANVSPPLKWGGAPAGAKSFVLICEDIDAPFGVFVHWVVYNIPVSVSRLPRQVPTDQVLSDGARQSQNDFDHTGYGGPCPPHGKHRYVFHVYAVDIVLDQGSLKRDAVDKAIKNHILAQGQLTGTYQRG